MRQRCHPDLRHDLLGLRGAMATDLEPIDPHPSDVPHPKPGGTDRVVAAASAVRRSLWRGDIDEVLAVVLLGAATLLSARGAYQSTRWSGK